ncbi:hypothetical protein DFA_03097 [Cavenderia fasciculata]|uniref:Uncharacterized protein n=1 Tax=Cavenderia fasciculata TaxID=261658 RepID=F4PGL8_CACFS|nr:uncharacterized protein DFA_03097 [Cavenderia fasciculata]EGG24852.1 hypothetical protein DFA_03097 [Cavenderia fasciculata]|eukprot:XP_004362703.1 hypothetical protein DFA_03097 [Cavenderia fasciculata]
MNYYLNSNNIFLFLGLLLFLACVGNSNAQINNNTTNQSNNNNNNNNSTMFKVEALESYHGWRHCYRIRWHHFNAIVVSDVGPRILSLTFDNDQSNLFFEQPDDFGNVGGDKWRLYGGHRLWHAPEVSPRTYYPDNEKIDVTIANDHVILTQPIEKTNNIAKQITIYGRGGANQSNAHLEIVHQLTNHNQWAVPIAPWAVTVMAARTKSILPMGVDDPQGLQPKSSISIWNYTKLKDERITLGMKYLLAQQNSTMKDANKVGVRSSNGWSASVNDQYLFIKRISQLSQNHVVDLGANIEAYMSPDYLELETIGALTQLEPKASASLTEKWFLFKSPTIFNLNNDQDVDQQVLPFVHQTSSGIPF